MIRTTTTRIATIAALAATLAPALPAQAFVPGSDTEERARSNAATHSVVLGAQQGGVLSRTSYGYPQPHSTGTLVPASNHSSKILDAAGTHSVVQSVAGGTIQPSVSALARGLIPGSDSFD